MQEVFKPVVGYEGLYEVSDLGRVKSLGKCSTRGFNLSNRILKGVNNGVGYLGVQLYRDGTPKRFSIHRLVMTSFVGESSLIVDHINEDKEDNRLLNLEYVTNRDNSLRYRTNNNKRGLPVGVYLNKGKYLANIRICGKKKYLGSYDTPEQASIEYQHELLKLEY